VINGYGTWCETYLPESYCTNIIIALTKCQNCELHDNRGPAIVEQPEDKYGVQALADWEKEEDPVWCICLGVQNRAEA
jgi:hypothetical protein